MSNALIVGTGGGISASFARALLKDGWSVAIAGRSIESRAIAGLEAATRHVCDASDAGAVEALFRALDEAGRTPDLVLYNASARTRGPVLDLDPAAVANCIAVTAFGAFLVAQAAARRMVPKSSGAIFFTGASASLKGNAQSAPFAMGKFAMRGLAQSMARELQPKGVHVAHFVIDGMVSSPERPADPAKPDAMLDPDAIAATYMAVLKQPRSAWSTEVELRPWVETF
jgi:NAD(P)-dependent dehydrogenase (short-subunit alcohol dehydrogenase family)